MWSENMDKKIRAAAGDTGIHGPDENTWKKMEALLDTHLPQKKRKRRFLFFLLTGLLLAGITGFFLVKKLSPGHQQPASAPGNLPARRLQTSDPQPHHFSQPGTGVTDNTSARTGNPATRLLQPRNSRMVVSTTVEGKNNYAIPITHPGRIAGKQATPEALQPGHKTGTASPAELPDRQPATAAPILPGTEKQIPVPAGADTATAAKPAPADKPDSLPVQSGDPVTKKPLRKQAAGKLSLSLSTGPDISGIGLQAGKWRYQYGVGIGYDLSDRLTLRTGFYAARKIYSADSTNYHRSLTDVLYYKLDKIDADCFVYEIPVLLTYHFSTVSNHNWFVSAGLSSLLMKKEDYTASYITPLGQTQVYVYSYANANAHFFSVINISAGYRYHVNKRLSLMAEPYIKIPATGVGYGKVKLNSAGLLFSATFAPF